MRLRTCVTPHGTFRYVVHRPSYRVANLRPRDYPLPLGRLPDGTRLGNEANFPPGDVSVEQASTVYEIPNAFSFPGSTFIDASWADKRARDPSMIQIASPGEVSLTGSLQQWAHQEEVDGDAAAKIFHSLPAPLLLALATTSTDPEDLVRLARMACDFKRLPGGRGPSELAYFQDEEGRTLPVIHDRDLFEAVANNPGLPYEYQEAMLLRPGAQGGSEVVGDYRDQVEETHVFEYLRRNSYIPWGHYAANMGHDAVRYRIKDLSGGDMEGLRHLYYQRVYVRLASELGLDVPRTTLSKERLESMRQDILAGLGEQQTPLAFTGSLWGWNFGFDFAPTRYKLHGSHQQIHQQNAMIPARVQVVDNGREVQAEMDGFSCGDLVAEVSESYEQETGQEFFEDFIRCLRSNRRTDGREGEHSLIVFEDQQVLLLVPKAQMSQWELQLMPRRPVGNILEADTACRASLDKGMLLALCILEGLGAKMVTSIELSKRFTEQKSSQRLIYSFLPKLPWSPGSFSEAQSRFICSHYPEDFAIACRGKLREIEAQQRARE